MNCLENEVRKLEEKRKNYDNSYRLGLLVFKLLLSFEKIPREPKVCIFLGWLKATMP
jgi:hypothetical protein